MLSLFLVRVVFSCRKCAGREKYRSIFHSNLTKPEDDIKYLLPEERKLSLCLTPFSTCVCE